MGAAGIFADGQPPAPGVSAVRLPACLPARVSDRLSTADATRGLCAARISTPRHFFSRLRRHTIPAHASAIRWISGRHYPEPGYLDGYGPSQPGMNTMALVSLISALVGVLCCIGSIVGIVFGAIAINQIKQTREEGYGLAVAGIVIGIATLLVYMIAGIFAIP